MSTPGTPRDKVEQSTTRAKGEEEMQVEDANANFNNQGTDGDVEGLETLIQVIDGHVFIECPEPANARGLYKHADPREDETGRTDILCEGCHENKDAQIYHRHVCAGCGEVTWYQQLDGGTIQ